MKQAVSLFLVVVLFLCLAGCNSSQREYYDEVVIDLQNSSEKIIIKEWSYLQGSGAEVYYQKGDAEPILIGKTTGSDDGFCPFKEGLYDITQDGNSLTVKWCFNPSDKDKSTWKSKTFELPQ